MCVSASLGETGGPVRVPCPVIAVGKEKQGKKRGMKGWEGGIGFVPGWEDKKETFSFAADVHTDTSVRACTQSTMEQPWRRSQAAPRASPQLPTTCRTCPMSGLSPPFRRLGNVADFPSAPASRSAQTTCFVRTSAVWVDFPWW